MAIYVGSQRASGLYLGSVSLTALWLGTSRVSSPNAENYFRALAPTLTETNETNTGFRRGIKFQVPYNGDLISAVQVFLAAGSPTTGTATIYDASTGTALATKAATGLTAGWNRIPFDTAVTGDMAKVYVSGFHQAADGGGKIWYPYIGSYFDSTSNTRYSQNFMIALLPNDGSSVGGVVARNGLWDYGATPAMPTGTFSGNWYGVDVEVTAGARNSGNVAPKPWPGATASRFGYLATYPDESNTGHGLGTNAGVPLVPFYGMVRSTANNQVIQNLDIYGSIYVSHSGVTIKNCRINGFGFYGVQMDGTAGGANVTVQDCTISNLGTGTQGGTCIIGGGTFLRNRLINCENAIVLTTASTVQDNLIYSLTSLGGDPHYDGIEINGGGGHTISHNTIFNDNGQTSAVMINNANAAVDNILVDNNYLCGGGYTCYMDGSKSATNTFNNIVFSNNKMRQGSFGYFSINNGTQTPSTPVAQTNNTLLGA